MISIQAVIFDYGNVLCEPQKGSDQEAMAAVCGLERDQFEQLYWKFRDSYDSGLLDACEYWTQIGKSAGLKLSAEQIDQNIALDNTSWSRPAPPMVRWANALRATGIKTAILSNMPLQLRKHITACDWLPAFDHSVYSCDVGCIKPAVEIYQLCLQGIGVLPQATLFLDDRQPNIDAAQAVGINGHLFTEFDQLCSALSEQYQVLHPLPNSEL